MLTGDIRSTAGDAYVENKRFVFKSNFSLYIYTSCKRSVARRAYAWNSSYDACI